MEDPRIQERISNFKEIIQTKLSIDNDYFKMLRVINQNENLITYRAKCLNIKIVQEDFIESDASKLLKKYNKSIHCSNISPVFYIESFINILKTLDPKNEDYFNILKEMKNFLIKKENCSSMNYFIKLDILEIISTVLKPKNELTCEVKNNALIMLINVIAYQSLP